MPPRRLRLKPGYDPRRAAEILRARINDAGNITARSAGVGADSARALQAAYLEWAEATERQLAGLTLDAKIPAALHTARYWHIRTLTDDPRPFPLVEGEVRQQVEWLDS